MYDKPMTQENFPKEVLDIIKDVQKKACSTNDIHIMRESSLRARGHLIVAGFKEAGEKFWLWVCSGMPKGWGFDDEEIIQTILNIRELDEKSFVMPSWGTYGT